ncbi:PPC domain-containing protein [Akkermansiaceae bacterium]|nr:PPC domain-containing protein [Akkermansiaceae bacterium]
MALITQSFGLTPISPAGGQRGTDVTVTLRDDNIASFQELITYQPGLSLSGLKVNEKDNKLATATLHIAPDAPLGEHSVRIRTAYDISYVRPFWVGPFPSVKSVEFEENPNPIQRVELNTTVEGTITLEDVDMFVVALKKGQRLSVEAEAMRLGRVLFDAYIAVLDPKDTEIASCDDSPFLKTDPFVSFIAPEDGDYRIVIREAAYEGGDSSKYRLHIGTFPRPTAVFPPGGKPGETLDLTFIGDPTGPFVQTVTLPSEASPDFAIHPVQNGETAPSPVPFAVSPLEHSSQPQNNTGLNLAHPFPPIPSAVDGILDATSPQRWFSFTAKKGQNLDIRLIARSLGSPLDSVLSVRDAKYKTLISSDDDQLSPDSFIKWTCPEDGTYYLQLRDQLGRTGPDFTFRIEIENRRPAISASLPVAERNESQKEKFFTIPRGNRSAAVIQLKRENTACDIAFETVDLPPGIRMIAPPVPKSLNSFPVIFEASPDAPPGSSLQAFTIRATGEQAPENLSGALSDTVHHIEVNNEGTYHSFSSDRIPTAVTEAVPFSIELAPPAVPIVRNGKLMLRMQVTRSGDFKGKITAKLPWFPPGITGPVTVEIPPEKTEAEYELNASAEAAAGTWQICVMAASDTPNGRRSVSSQFAPLIVAEPYLSFTLDLAAGRIGEPSALLAKIEQLREFSGEATAELLSLPFGVTSSPVKFTKDQSEITFPLTIAADAKPGKTTGLLCKVLVPEGDAMVTHQTGQGGTLRIDPAPKKEEGKPAPKPQPEVAGATPPAKPLSRLEQLRQKK